MVIFSQATTSKIRSKGRRFADSVRLWWLIPMRFIGIPLFLLGLAIGVVGGFFPGVIQTGISWLGAAIAIASLAFWIVSFLAPVAVFTERRRMPESAPWVPSRWYYFMIFPTGPLGLLLSIVYTKRRVGYYGNTKLPEVNSEEDTQDSEDLTREKDPYLKEEIRANVNDSSDS